MSLPAHAPLGWLFRTEKAPYFYDTNTNQILRVTENVGAALAALGVNGASAFTPKPDAVVDQGSQDLRRLQTEDGYCLSNRPSSFVPFAQRHWSGKLQNGPDQIILEVTESCNLRCSYCAYSGKYSYSRGHSAKQMINKTARAAIDTFIKERSIDPQTLSFYGGEPLLRMNTIEGIVTHAKTRAKKLRFSVTTNGTLLTPERWQFLAAHEFSVAISLDGPALLHDRNRKTSRNAPTHARVIDNLHVGRSQCPKFFAGHVLINCTTGPETDFEQLVDYFATEPAVRGCTIIFSSIVDTNFAAGTDSSFATPCDGSACVATFAPTWQRFVNALLTDSEPPTHRQVMQFLLSGTFRKLLTRKRFTCVPRHMPCNGMCLPGKRRVFVDTDGNVHMCEKVPRSIPIGNVWQGLSWTAVSDLLDAQASARTQFCDGCWATRLCTMCPASVGSHTAADRSLMVRHCRSTRDDLEFSIRLFTRLLEADVFALDDLGVLTVR